MNNERRIATVSRHDIEATECIYSVAYDVPEVKPRRSFSVPTPHSTYAERLYDNLDIHGRNPTLFITFTGKYAF